MKKMLITFMAVVLLLGSVVQAEVQSLQFDSIRASITLPDSYTVAVTQDTLDTYGDFFLSVASSLEKQKTDFAQDGILFRAFDVENDRVLTLYAVEDDSAKQYFNINEHTNDIRAAFRLLHSKSDYYKAQGYTYTSVQWKNYPTKRWLALAYTLKDSQGTSYGYQRRTVYNGYTITLEMTTSTGRKLKKTDENAFSKVFKDFIFTETLPLPALPVKFIEEKSAPAETDKPTFTMKGKTAPNAKITAVIGSFATAQTQVVEAVAKANGNYELEITLPQEDRYFMTLTVQAEGAITLEKQYAITYMKDVLNVEITSAPAAALQDTTVIAGTTQRGATAVLTVNGRVHNGKVNTKGNFSFSIDTSQNGDYAFKLTITKAGYETRVFSYNGTRAVTKEEQAARTRNKAKTVEYQKLVKNIDLYDGQILMYEGVLLSKEELAGEWLLRFDVSREGGKGQLVILSSDHEPEFTQGKKMRAYGILVGTTGSYNQDGVVLEYPKLQLRILEAVE
ncbi:MAG: hypothetical protein ACOX6G_07725 [Christensenellales bacterium]